VEKIHRLCVWSWGIDSRGGNCHRVWISG